MKKALGILMAAVVTVAAMFAMVGCGDTSAMLTEPLAKQSDIDRLSDTVAMLKGKVNDLMTENGALKDCVDGLNVFWTDKAEYSETETMIVYYKNKPVLKIRLGFDNLYGTPLWGGAFNCDLYVTSLCADIYDESIIGTMLIACDNGIFARKPSSQPMLLKRDIEKATGGSFYDVSEYCKGSTWFDLVICVPGTPFELARFKNVSYHE